MSKAQAGGRRRLEPTTPPGYEVPTRGHRIDSPRAAKLVVIWVILAWAISAVGASTAIIAIDHWAWIERVSAALLMVVLAVGLTHRGGGRMRIWVPITAGLGVIALATSANVALAAAAAVTGVLAAVGAIMVTRPADSAIAAVREYVIALLVALSGTVGVAAWNAPVNYQRFNLVVLTAALGMAIALVWNLGAGLHGLGKQNLAILVGVAALLVLVMAYSSFVRSNGSQWLVDFFTESIVWMRQTFGGVPRPVEVFIGFPALVVGVSMRSRRREGWWILVFAVIGTGVMTTSLVTPGAFPSYIGLSTLYSSILGLIIGLVLRHFTLRERSSRAARAIEPVERSEPPRIAALK